MTTLSANVIMHVSPTLSIHPFINTHKAAVIIKYKNTQSTMNRKIYKRNKIKKTVIKVYLLLIQLLLAKAVTLCDDAVLLFVCSSVS